MFEIEVYQMIDWMWLQNLSTCDLAEWKLSNIHILFNAFITLTQVDLSTCQNQCLIILFSVNNQ